MLLISSIPEARDEVGEPRIFAHGVVNQRQRREKLELGHEHEGQRRGRSPMARMRPVLLVRCSAEGCYRTHLGREQERGCAAMRLGCVLGW